MNIREKLKNISVALGILFLYLGLSYVLTYIFIEAFNSNNHLISSTCLILRNLFILLVIALFFIPKLICDAGALSKSDLKIAYKNWFIGLLIMYISNIFILLINKDLAANEATNRAILDQMPVVGIILMVVIAPITEELIFRLSLKNIFKNKYIYCIFSGLIFGLLHLTSWNEILFIIPYGALGFFFAKTLYDTDNIYAPIITHITHNAMIIFILILENFVGI